MGFRFSLEHANWLAHLLQPIGATPKLDDFSGTDALQRFVSTFERNYYPSYSRRRELVRHLLHEYELRGHGRHIDREVLSELRWYFRDVPWVALLIPHGLDPNLDRAMTDPMTLEELVEIRADDPGLILQLDGLQDPRDIQLDNVFPAFQVALENATRWPGVLIWADRDAVFLALPRSVERLRDALHWIFSHLATSVGHPDLAVLKQQYVREVKAAPPRKSRLQILHLSDLHLGSRVARLRLPRVKTLIRSTVDELSDDDPVVPVVTGDLMDSPSEENLDELRSFSEFLHGLGVDDPIMVLGNHDVRKDGWLAPIHEYAIHVERDRVVWKDGPKVAIASFNSVVGGKLARGSIGERELSDVGDALDRHKEKSSDYAVVALLHHHPVPVEIPKWYRSAWYERIGSVNKKTQDLLDAAVFLGWVQARRITAVLHGHKHIPRFTSHKGTSIIGCGSSVGKVDTVERGQTCVYERRHDRSGNWRALVSSAFRKNSRRRLRARRGS